MLEKVLIIFLSILYASSESIQEGDIQCINIKGDLIWAVYTFESDGKHGSWFLCDLTGPMGKQLCSCGAAMTPKGRRMYKSTVLRHSPLKSIVRDGGCRTTLIKDCSWLKRCIPHFRIRQTLWRACIKSRASRSLRDPSRFLRFKMQLAHKPVTEFSQMIQNQISMEQNYPPNVKENHRNYNPISDMQNYDNLDSVKTKIGLSHGNIRESLLVTNYSKFAVARRLPYNPQSIASEIVQQWGPLYGLQYSMLTKGRVCFVTVWKKNRLENHKNMTNVTVYDIILREIGQYFQNSTCSDCRAFIRKTANQTMYCVSRVGCMAMAIGFDSATNNSAKKIPQSWDILKPHLYLYSKESGSQPIDVLQGNQSCFGTSHNSLFVLVHGFRSSGKKEWLLETKDAIISKNGTFLVIIVDWNACKFGFTAGAYLQVSINSYAVGAILAYGLQRYLVKPSCLDPENVHLIGHSVGAHVVATAGSTFLAVTGTKIGKITGLDPAGPWFGDKDTTLRLDKDDAQHVEVFHTNSRNDNATRALSPIQAVLQSKYGVRNPDGHIDFYINGGVRQPKCTPFISTLMCSHLRAHEYFTQSVKTACKFIGFYCTGKTTDEQVINCFHGNYTTSSRAVMGLHIPKVDHIGVYYVITTNDTSAFCDEAIAKKYPTP